MPYIKRERRADVDTYLANPHRGSILAPQDCGELNYAVTMACLRSREPHAREGLSELVQRIIFDYLTDPAKPLRYQRINDAAGAIACAALELEDRCPTRRFELATLHRAMWLPYREIAVAYEKLKIKENGDIAEYGNPR